MATSILKYNISQHVKNCCANNNITKLSDIATKTSTQLKKMGFGYLEIKNQINPILVKNGFNAIEIKR